MFSKFSVKRIFYGWWIVGVCFLLGLFGTGIISYSFTSFIQPITAEFGWSYTQISFAMSLRGLEVGLASPISGWLVDKWGARKVVFCGSIISCLGLLLLFQTQSLSVFYVSFILIGIGAGSCTTSVTIPTVANWFRKHMGLATGIAISGGGAAGLFLPLITYIIELYGWRLAVLAIMLSIFMIVLPLSLTLRHKPEHHGLMLDGQPITERDEQGIIADRKLQKSELSLKQALRSRVFWQLVVILICLLLVLSAVSTHVMPYLASIGIDRYTSSFVASAISVISIIGRIGLGWFSDRYDRKLVTAGAFATICLSMTCFGMAATSGMWLIVPFFILFGIGYGGALALSGSLTNSLFGRSSFGSIYGLIMGIAVIGTISGAPLAGWVYDNWGTYQWFWLVMACVSVMAAILVLTVSSPTGKNRV